MSWFFRRSRGEPWLSSPPTTSLIRCYRNSRTSWWYFLFYFVYFVFTGFCASPHGRVSFHLAFAAFGSVTWFVGGRVGVMSKRAEDYLWPISCVRFWLTEKSKIDEIIMENQSFRCFRWPLRHADSTLLDAHDGVSGTYLCLKIWIDGMQFSTQL